MMTKVDRRQDVGSSWWTAGALPMQCLAVLAIWGSTGTVAVAQRTDSYSGGQPRWRLVESDCGAELSQHEISQILPHSEPTCEMFEVACGRGSFVHLAYPIEPCNPLDEFTPQLWTRCSSGRIRLGARVIFPFAAHPVTGGRLNAILWGDTYDDTGQWQMLRIEEIEKLLQQERISIRQRFGSALNLDGAYIDSLVLNAYTGPGRYRVQVDDLDLRGMITMAATGNPPPRNWRERWRWRYEVPSSEDRFWASPNRPPVWFNYRGESLPWLRSLKFTGLFIEQMPSQEQLRRIQDASLAVICPPPEHDVMFEPAVAAAVRGWLIGSTLDSRQADRAREMAASVDRLSPELHKPLVGEALESYWLFSRIADEVIVPTPAPTAPGSYRDKQFWLSSTLKASRPRGSGWVSLSIDDNPGLQQQWLAAKRAIDPLPNNRRAGMDQENEDVEELPSDPLRVRHQAVGAVMAGARGFVFRSSKPLGIQTPADSARVAGLRWLNHDLELWGPWIMAGQTMQPPSINRDDYRSAMWGLSKSRLVILQTQAEGVDACLPATATSPLAIKLDESGVGVEQVVRLTHGALDRLTVQREANRIQWRVDDPAEVEVFVVTENPTVLGFLNKRLPARAAEIASDHLEIVAYNTSLAESVLEARFPPAGIQAAIGDTARLAAAQRERLAVAHRHLEQGWQALRANRPATARRAAYRASDLTQEILYDAYQVATDEVPAPQSSPLVLTPGMLGYHWRMAEACRRSQWAPLPLPGNELANLSRMLDLGWSQQRRLAEQFDLRVELVPLESSTDSTGEILRSLPTNANANLKHSVGDRKSSQLASQNIVRSAEPVSPVPIDPEVSRRPPPETRVSPEDALGPMWGQSNGIGVSPRNDAVSPGGLRLAAYAKQSLLRGLSSSGQRNVPGGYEGASLRVRSAAAEVQAGQLVRISALAEILHPPATPDSGLLVYDNQAGPGLGQLVRGQRGDVVPVELYRMIPNDGKLRVLAECRGECDILLHSIGLSVIRPATDRRNFPTGPLSGFPNNIVGEAYQPGQEITLEELPSRQVVPPSTLEELHSPEAVEEEIRQPR